MENQILDHFDFEDRFNPETRVVAIKFFNFESEARLYAARLKEVGIRSFISNTNTHTVIPLSGGSIGLHIKEQDAKDAQKIIQRMETFGNQEPDDQSFHDADLEEIAYQRALHERNSGKIDPAMLAIVLIILLILTQLVLRAGGLIGLPITKHESVQEGKTEQLKKTSTQETYQENKFMSGLAL